MHKFKFSLKQKLIFSFITIAFIPLIIVNTIWFNSSRNDIVLTTSQQLESTAMDVSHQLDGYFEVKRIGLIIHSQTESILESNISKATAELQNYLLQDKDILELSLLDQSGKEIIRINRDKVYAQNELRDLSVSPLFKVPTFVGGEMYIGSLYFNSQDEPEIQISIPIVKPDIAQSLRNLTTSSFGRIRHAGEIQGVLIETVSLKNLWDSILAYKIGDKGYVLIINDKGDIIGHTNNEFVKNKKNIRNVDAINNFIASLTSNADLQKRTLFAQNESDTSALMSFQRVKATNWGIVSQIPSISVFKNVNQIIVYILIISAFVIGLILIGSLALAKRITRPIHDLQEGSKSIGLGNLSFRINIKTGDEIEELGNAFNTMTQNLKNAFDRVEQNKEIIEAERNKISVTLANIADGVIAVNLQKQVIIFNKSAEQISGIPAQEAIGKKIFELFQVYLEDQELDHNAYCPVKAGYDGIIFNKENLKIVSSRNESFVNLIAANIRQAESVNLGCILTIHDVSKEVELENMKLDFVSMAAHELRTPITTIRGYLSVYMQENEKNFNEEQKTFLDRISSAANQLVALVEDILSTSRIERGTFSLSLSRVDMVALARDVINQLLIGANEKKISLSVIEPSVSIPAIEGDKSRLTEVLSNLITNGINYTNESGEVKVSFEYKENEIIVHVHDNGQGIPKEAIPHLFTKFYQVQSGKLHGTKGTGLGLYLSKEIVEKHNGKIWVESVEGKGSTFSFSLPVRPISTNQSDNPPEIKVV